ncbi:chemotaxis protein CheC [Methanococcus voltae]|uniref:CheC, inhibitor of MCP methylation n=1 Tax=Methanococcus voltae (strain ATCC BAA-1334 / A3) TaxID=456320 RepID=D7DU03_METV3|nr:chemotaxis protein CheC [Methanococcus voltae]MCS3900413.1 chemotaxis protein CheC [Methanococcus voltae]
MGVIDAIKKITEIGQEAAENVGDSFTGLTGQSTDVSFLGTRFVPLERLPEQFSEDYCKITKIDFDGILTGNSMLILPEVDAVKLEKLLLLDLIWDSLTNKTDMPDYKEMESSVINEVANIVLAAFLNVFANELNGEINITTPKFAKDAGFNVVESLVIELMERNVEYALVFDTKIEVVGRFPLNCNILIMINPETINNLDKLYNQ